MALSGCSVSCGWVEAWGRPSSTLMTTSSGLQQLGRPWVPKLPLLGGSCLHLPVAFCPLAGRERANIFYPYLGLGLGQERPGCLVPVTWSERGLTWSGP